MGDSAYEYMLKVRALRKKLHLSLCKLLLITALLRLLPKCSRCGSRVAKKNVSARHADCRVD